ncbi:MAG: WD40 repeat domain-containing protein [Planctomycetota bacterium]
MKGHWHSRMWARLGAVSVVLLVAVVACVLIWIRWQSGSHVGQDWLIAKELPYPASSRDTVTFSPDGRRAAVLSGEDNMVRILETQHGELVNRLAGHTASVFSAQYSSDGKLLVTADVDRNARVWDTMSGDCLAVLRGDVLRARFSPTGDRVVTTGNGNTARIWDWRVERCLVSLSGHVGQRLRFAAYFPSGDRVLTSRVDGTAKIWNAESGECLRTIPYHPSYGSLGDAQFWPDGKRLLVESSNAALIYFAASGMLGMALEDPGLCAQALSPTGDRAATGTFQGSLKIWDTGTGECVASPAGHDGGRICGVEFDPKGDTLLSYGADCTARVWDARTGECKAVLVTDEYCRLRGEGACLFAAFSPDGRQIVTRGHEGVVQVWRRRSASRDSVDASRRNAPPNKATGDD